MVVCLAVGVLVALAVLVDMGTHVTVDVLEAVVVVCASTYDI